MLRLAFMSLLALLLLLVLGYALTSLPFLP